MKKYSLAVHGGAGTILKSLMSKEMEQGYHQGLADALKTGQKILSNGGTSIDAVMSAVVSLENNPLFNAGKGSVFSHDGVHEMDASIMCGNTLKAGAIAGVQKVKNPVLLARAVMDKTEHVLLYGQGAEILGRLCNLEFEEPAYFHDSLRYNQWLAVKDSSKTMLDHSGIPPDKKFGTVGAVALDLHGNLAAATSTGGMTNKKFNRIGDTPLIGAGNYANNLTCAVSCTGHGEYFIRAVVAYDISCMLEYKGLSLAEACHEVVHKKLVSLGGEGGLIAIDHLGHIELPFNSEGMYRGFVSSDHEMVISIYK